MTKDEIKALEGAELIDLTDAGEPRAVSPLNAPLTLTVCHLYALGFRFAYKKAFLDATEILADGTPHRVVTWTFSAGSKAEIAGKLWSIREVLDAIEDEAWCRANPGHPIAYAAAALKAFREIRAKLRGDHEQPLQRHRKFVKRAGKQTDALFLPFDLSDEETQAELRKHGML